MGLNAVVTCDKHRVALYMMRGEESADLQRWMREHSEDRGCVMRFYRDADHYPQDWPEPWPFEERPAVRCRAGHAVYDPMCGYCDAGDTSGPTSDTPQEQAEPSERTEP